MITVIAFAFSILAGTPPACSATDPLLHKLAARLRWEREWGGLSRFADEWWKGGQLNAIVLSNEYHLAWCAGQPPVCGIYRNRDPIGEELLEPVQYSDLRGLPDAARRFQRHVSQKLGPRWMSIQYGTPLPPDEERVERLRLRREAKECRKNPALPKCWTGNKHREKCCGDIVRVRVQSETIRPMRACLGAVMPELSRSASDDAGERSLDKFLVGDGMGARFGDRFATLALVTELRVSDHMVLVLFSDDRGDIEIWWVERSSERTSGWRIVARREPQYDPEGFAALAARIRAASHRRVPLIRSSR